MKLKIKEVHPLQWIVEPLESDPTFMQRKMFGCEMISIDFRQSLVLAASDEPWNGLLVCTSREHHESLKRDFPALEVHPVLGKWLYISQSEPEFESVAQELRERVAERDPRIGIEPKPKKRKKSGWEHRTPPA